MSSTRKKNAAPTVMLSVYGYIDYRRYLFDYYQLRKESHQGFSYRAFAKSAGFSSPNYLKLIMDGKRNLSRQAVEKLIIALNLRGSMAAYFRHMVLLNQADSDEDRQLNFESMQCLIPQAKRRDLGSSGVRYLSHWLFPVVREMALLPRFNGDPHWLVRRLNQSVSVSEVRDALDFLRREGFLVQSPSGEYRAQDNLVMSSDEVRSLAVRNYHRQMLACARDALELVPMEQREFGALTTVLPHSALPELKHRLKRFRQELHAWVLQLSESESGDSVIQINFQMFPFNKAEGHE